MIHRLIALPPARLDPPILAGCLLLAFGSALLVTYGHSDDYLPILDQHIGLGGAITDLNSAVGRPILGYLNQALFRVAGDVPGLALPRALGLALLTLLGLAIRRRLLFLGLPRWDALVLATACVLTPSAAVYVGWSITSAALLAGLLALWAASLAEQGWLARRSAGGPGRGLAWLMASLLALVVALLVYQPLAPLFLFSAVLGLAFGHTEGRGPRYLLAALGLYCCALALYYAIYRLGIVPVHATNPNLARAELGISPLRTLEYVGLDVLPSLLGGWEYIRGGVRPESPDWPVRWTVTLPVLAVLVLVGLRRLGATDGGGPPRRLATIAAVLLAWAVSLLPMVILREPYAPTRTLFFSYALVCLLAYLGVKALVRAGPWRGGPAVVGLMLLTAQAGLTFWDGLVRVQGREYAVLRQAVLAFPAPPPVLWFIPPRAAFAPGHAMPTRHEYYVYSSMHAWVPLHLFNQIWLERLRSEGRDEGHLRGIGVVRLRPGQPPPAGDAPVIDAQALLCGVPGLP